MVELQLRSSIIPLDVWHGSEMCFYLEELRWQNKTEEFSLISHSFESRAIQSQLATRKKLLTSTVRTLYSTLRVHVCAVSKPLAFELLFLSPTFINFCILPRFSLFQTISRTYFIENITCIFRRWHCSSRTWTRKKHPLSRACAPENKNENSVRSSDHLRNIRRKPSFGKIEGAKKRKKDAKRQEEGQLMYSTTWAVHTDDYWRRGSREGGREGGKGREDMVVLDDMEGFQF